MFQVRYNIPNNRPFKLKMAMETNTPWSKQMEKYQYSNRNFINASIPHGNECSRVGHVIEKYAEMTSHLTDMVDSYSEQKQRFYTLQQRFDKGLAEVEKEISDESKGTLLYINLSNQIKCCKPNQF